MPRRQLFETLLNECFMKYINAPFKKYIINLDMAGPITYQLSPSSFKIELK